MDLQEQRRQAAVDDFRRARRRAIIEDLLAWLRGEPDDLLDFTEVQQRLGAQQPWATQGPVDVPLALVVGSVGRYADFNRHFLPRRSSDEERWAGVREAMLSGRTLPPIELYELGGLYFVKDGNHRVSVARELGHTHLPAMVCSIPARASLPPDATADDVIIASEHAALLEATHLDELRPGLELRATAPGAHAAIAGQIERQRQRMALRAGRTVELPEAAASWYDDVYLPAVEMIRERGLLADFTGRTETDLYVWTAAHQEALEAELGWPVPAAAAAADLARRHSPRARHMLERARRRLLAAVVPETVRPGPPPGYWRRAHAPTDGQARIFHRILTPLSGDAGGWLALEQALVLARREGAAVYGLHVLPPVGTTEAKLAAMRAEFEARTAAAGVAGVFAAESGTVVSRICARAHWADLVVIRLAHPPPDQPFARLRSGARDLVQRSPQPLLTVPDTPTPLCHALLAYHGGPRADEALYLAAYLALHDDMALTVLTVLEQIDAGWAAVERAQRYLQERGVSASYVVDRRPPAQAILATAKARDADLIVLGGYGSRPEIEIVRGSSVDQVLRASHVPVLISR
ncbi:MAG: universal stress protein [Chloroflexi bacterium OHK40]